MEVPRGMVQHGNKVQGNKKDVNVLENVTIYWEKKYGVWLLTKQGIRGKDLLSLDSYKGYALWKVCISC